MVENANLDVLSTRSGFNSAVRHIKKTMDIVTSAGSGNRGDILYELDDEELTSNKVGLLLRMLLVDKLGYKTASTNLSSTVNDVSVLSREFGKWNGVDLVAAYYHPEMGLLVANPKVAEELAGFGDLRKRELMVVYAGFQGKQTNDNCQKAAHLALNLFEGGRVTVPSVLTKGRFTVKKVSKPKKETEPKKAKPKAAKPKAAKKAAPAKTKKAAATPAAAPKRMTPRYAVVVQNELFHNGNVEAWKKIIESYKAKHPGLEVFIYYEMERIQDINTLFRWGKVKHGSAIEFAVAGDEIQDVAKLQRYLAQGASHQFEAFLKGPVNTVLKLF
jgi:cell division septation protein DedD